MSPAHDRSDAGRDTGALAHGCPGEPGDHVAAAMGIAALSALALVPTASGEPDHSARNRTTFVDERGEAPGSADVTRVVVSNDDAGRITADVAIAGRPTLTQDMRLRVGLRDVRGRDSFLLVDPFTPAGFAAQLYRCKPRAGGLVCSPSQRANVRFSYAKGARFSLDAEDLGLRPSSVHPTRLRFWVATLAGVRYDPTAGYDLSAAHFDRAPSNRRRVLELRHPHLPASREGGKAVDRSSGGRASGHRSPAHARRRASS
jgi:hypothetical protein